jgi:hypothetical protein
MNYEDGILVDGRQPATLNDGDGKLVDCPSLREAVLGWRGLPQEQRSRATVKVIGGSVYNAQEIPLLYYQRRRRKQPSVTGKDDSAIKESARRILRFGSLSTRDGAEFRNVDPFFSMIVESLAPKLARLMDTVPVRYGELPREPPLQGVYLFTERGRHLYVGRSNNLRDRYDRHWRANLGQREAEFVIALAREETGRVTAYQVNRQRRGQLTLDSAFAATLVAAKERVKAMEFRFVEENDQTRQALLEIYCAIALQAPYNSFMSHQS